MEIFNDHIIVDEKAINSLNFKNGSTYSEITPFASLEFLCPGCYSYPFLTIKDIGNNASTNSPEPLAQIVLWKWAQGNQSIVKTIILNKGGTTPQIETPAFMVIRILKKREIVENPCPPICSPDDDLTVHIGARQLTVSAHWLMSVSPMVNRMLSVDMAEKQQRALKLDGLGITRYHAPAAKQDDFPPPISRRRFSAVDFKPPISRRRFPAGTKDTGGKSAAGKEVHRPAAPPVTQVPITMEQFIEFMQAISPSSLRQPFFPNPQNVLDFLWFADYFQIDWLMERCGVHLANCVEIPFAERFLMIERYKLSNLMQHFSHLLKELTKGK